VSAVLEAPAARRSPPRRGAIAGGLGALVEDAHAKWALPPRAGPLLFLVPPAVAVLGIVLALADPDAFLSLSREDSVLEWGQLASLVLAGAFVLLLARRRLRAREPRGALALAAVAAGCLLVAGEEISWSQRIVGFETPAEIADANRQEEVTVHNLDGVQTALKGVLVPVAVAGAALPWLAWARGHGGSLLVPPLFLTSVFIVRLAYDAVRIADHPTGFLSADAHRRELFAFYSEWTELGIAYAAVAFAFLTWRRARIG
jgi:hypothetical protein